MEAKNPELTLPRYGGSMNLWNGKLYLHRGLPDYPPPQTFDLAKLEWEDIYERVHYYDDMWHSSVVVEGNMFVVGGDSGSDESMKEISLDTMEWVHLPDKMSTALPQRRQSVTVYWNGIILATAGLWGAKRHQDLWAIRLSNGLVGNWRPLVHEHFSDEFSATVVCMLCMHKRRGSSMISMLPKPIVYLILNLLSKSLGFKILKNQKKKIRTPENDGK